MSIEMLYTGESVRRAIRDLFRDDTRRRVAISAFLGKGAELYLPRTRGIEVYCWPSPGGTNPTAVKKLVELGAEVHFADRLHAKVYWAQGRGAVVTSANLSTNAFGRGDLIEVGVRLPASAVDIDKIIRSMRPAAVSSAAMERLEVAWAARPTGGSTTTTRGLSFPEWYASRPTRDTRWLLSLSEGYAPPSAALRERVREQHASRSIHDWLSCRRGEVKEDDYLLSLMFKGERITAVKWIHADHVVPVGRSDRTYSASYPFQVGQVAPLRQYRAPPFIIDAPFRQAVRAAYAEVKPFDGADIFPTAAPPRRLVNAIARHYAKFA